MRVSFITFCTASLLCSTAFAADPTANVPPGALNPPAYAPVPRAPSITPATDAAADANTLQGVEATAPVATDPATAAHDKFLRANNQLGADIRNHASKETIEADRKAAVEARKELDAAMKPPMPVVPAR